MATSADRSRRRGATDEPAAIQARSDLHRPGSDPKRHKRQSVVQRLRVRFTRSRLDQELADGCSAERSPLHALRARQLADPAVRSAVATALRHVVQDAMEPYAVLTPVRLRRTAVLVSLRQDEVREWRQGVRGLVERLEGSAAVNPSGVARARMLLTDGAGPLYNPNAERDLGETLWWIADGLALCPPHRWGCPVIAKLDPEHVAWTCERCGAVAMTVDFTVKPA
jgi:hypothetical protein